MNSENTIMQGTQNTSPIKEPQTPAAEAPGSRSRVGKIARLPLAIRQQLNQKLQDGHPAKPLLQWLNALPEVQAVLAAQFKGQPIVEQNLSAWKKGGYLDWAEEQNALHAVNTLLEESTGLQTVAKDGPTDRMTLRGVTQRGPRNQVKRVGIVVETMPGAGKYAIPRTDQVP